MLGRLVSSRGSVGGKEGTEAGLWPFSPLTALPLALQICFIMCTELSCAV